MQEENRRKMQIPDPATAQAGRTRHISAAGKPRQRTADEDFRKKEEIPLAFGPIFE